MKFNAILVILLVFNLAGNAQPVEEYPYDDQGIWNEFHSENLGKIVFSSQKIIHNSPDESLVKTTFDLTTPIKGRLYIRHSLANFCYELEQSAIYEKGAFDYATNPLLELICQITVNDTIQKLISIKMFDPSMNQEWTTWWYSFIPEFAQPWNYISSNNPEWAFGQIVQTLNPGNHRVNITAYLDAPSPYSTKRVKIAEGNFNLSFTKDQKGIWEEKYGYKEQEAVEYVYEETEETTSSTGSNTSNSSNTSSNAATYIEFKITNDSGQEFQYCYDDAHNYINAGGVKSFTCTEGQVFKRKSNGSCGAVWFKVTPDMNGKIFKVSELM